MNKRNLNRLAALIGAAFLAAPAFGQPSTAADAIYVGGDIVTMNDKAPTAQALAVKDGKILAVGDRKTVEAGHKGAKTKVVNLAGKTLLPGFIDAHSHYFSSLTVANQCNLYAPPAGPAKDVPSIIAAMKKFAADKKIPKGEVIQCYGYDENVMPNGRLLEPRRPRPGVSEQPGAGGACVDARRGAELGRDEEVEPQRRDQDAAGRRHRAQARDQRAVRADHGNGVPADLRFAAEADFGTGGRVVHRGPEAVRGRGRHHCARRCDARRGTCLDAACREVRRLRHRRDCLSVHHRTRGGGEGQPGVRLAEVRQPTEDRRREDHHRRLAAGQDRVLHQALPHGRSGRREGLERRADGAAGSRQQGGEGRV